MNSFNLFPADNTLAKPATRMIINVLRRTELSLRYLKMPTDDSG